MLFLSGCHGSGVLKTYEMPEEFDTTKDHEITFWAKNDTNKAQAAIYQKAAADFEKKKRDLDVAEADYRNAKDDLADSEIRAPFSGTITQIKTWEHPVSPRFRLPLRKPCF